MRLTEPDRERAGHAPPAKATAQTESATARPNAGGRLASILHAPAAVLADLIAPGLLAGLVFGAGLLLLTSAALPSLPGRLHGLDKLVPLFIVEFSHFAASLIGTALLFLAAGLASRLTSAWRLTVALLCVGAVASFFKGGDIEETIVFSCVAALALPLGPAFYRTDRLSQIRLSPKFLIAVAGSLGAVSWLGFFAYRNVTYSNELWWAFVLQGGGASRFLRASVGVAALTLFVVLRQVMARAPKPPPVGGPDEIVQAANILRTAEEATPDANLALLGDKRFLFSPDGQNFVQFGVRGNLWVALGGPVGTRADVTRQIRAFQEAADKQGAKCAFYALTRDHVADFVDCGFAVQKIGETALVDLPGFSLEGSKRAEMRHILNRGKRQGWSFEIVVPEDVPALTGHLARVSTEWLAAQNGQEKCFSLGRFDPAYLRQFPVAVIRQQDTIIAFANLWPTASKARITIDLMRYMPDAPNGLMDFLFVNVILWAKAEGFAIFDLGMAPLAGLENHRLAGLVSRIGALVFLHAGKLYGFEGLRAYKNKFQPRWEPEYIAAPSAGEIPGALAAAALLTSGGMTGLFG